MSLPTQASVQKPYVDRLTLGQIGPEGTLSPYCLLYK